MMRLLLLIIFITTSLSAQIYTQKDVEVCNRKFQMAVDADLQSKPINEVVYEVGKSFLGVDYEAGTLEKGENEELVIHLTGLDCYTLLETSLVFARSIKMGKTTFEDYQQELENIRYRGGVRDEYPSRLHYFSDWIYDMNKRGIVTDITKEIGGKPYDVDVWFMSKNSDKYKHLKDNPEYVEEIAEIEKEISSREYYWVPEDEIADVEDKVRGGDLIALTTGIGGLDISHVGIAVKKEGRLHFMHAPNVGYKVQITEVPLADYAKKLKRHTGMMVLRVNDVAEDADAS